MISDVGVRCVLGVSAATLFLCGIPARARGADNDCSRWLAAGRAAAEQGEGCRRAGNRDAMIDHLERAREAFAKAMKACPDSARTSLGQVQSRLAYSRYTGGQFDDACDVYARLLELEPGRLVDRALYADALEQSGHYKEALDQLQALIQAYPDRSPGFYCNMAMIYALDLGDGTQAVAAAMKGLERGGEEPCLRFAWGKGLSISGVGMLETSNASRGLELLEDARLKFAALEGDPEYGMIARVERADIEQRMQGERSKKAREKR